MKKITNLLKETLYILSRPQKQLCVLVFLMTCIGSVLECLGVSIIVPLVNVLMDGEAVKESNMLKQIPVVDKLSYQQLVLFIIAGIVFVYIFKNLFFIFLSWIRVRFACKIQREMSLKMMSSVMSRGYQYLLGINYGEFGRDVQGDAFAIYDVINAIFRLSSETLTIALICAFMVVTDYKLAISLVIIAIVCVVLIYFVFRKRMEKAGKAFRLYAAKMGQALAQSFFGAKEVILYRKQKHFIRDYERNSIAYNKAQCSRTVGSESPTYIIEAVCIVGIMISVSMRVISGTADEHFVSVLAAFAVGAFRVMPSLGRISVSINSLTSSIPQIDALYKNVRESEAYVEEHPEVIDTLISNFDKTSLISKGSIINKDKANEFKLDGKFKDKLEVKNVTFAYNEGLENILEDVYLSINKGEAIGLIGESGAGKSTLVDIILGLLLPQKGEVMLDGENIRNIPGKWSETIAYVPQSVYLHDIPLKYDVAFGELDEEINNCLVDEALKKAEMYDFIMNLPEGVNTEFGDRGVRLSGGQRQRIAIARAIYRNPEILVLDEATSALDNETESAIMSAINALYGKVTLIIVAHRLSTVEKCDVIYEVKNKQIIKRDKSEIFGSKND